MGRASRVQAEQNRERVVAVACRLFRTHGVENVSIADIMGAAGMTPGGFYKQFESREALVDEAFALAFTQSSGSWARVCNDPSVETGSGLAALVRHYFRQRAPEANCPMLTFASQASNLPADAKAVDVYEEGAETLFRQFREAASTLSGPDSAKALPEAEVMRLFAAMVGVGMLTRAIGGTPWIQALQSAVLDGVPGSTPGIGERA